MINMAYFSFTDSSSQTAHYFTYLVLLYRLISGLGKTVEKLSITLFK